MKNNILKHAFINGANLNIGVRNIEKLNILICEVEAKQRELNEAVNNLSRFTLTVGFKVENDEL